MEASNIVKKATEESFFIIWEALKAGENDTVMALLEGIDVKATVDSSKKTLLHLSALYGNIFITNHLINHGCTIDAEDDSQITPLMLAIYYRHLEVIQILIDAGADLCHVNSNGTSPVFYGQLENDPKIVQIITSAVKDKKAVKSKVIDSFMNVTTYKNKIKNELNKQLYHEEQMNYIDSLRFLRSDYYKIGKCSSEGVPLIKAVFLKDVYQLKMNLKYQVSPNIQDKNGWTALHAVATSMGLLIHARNKLSKITEMLFDYGADVNVKDNKGATPLHVAAAFGNVAFCNELIQQGADINARDNEGRTPLHAALNKTFYSFRKEKIVTLKFLLKNGADVSAISSKGETVLESTKYFIEPIRNFILENLAISSSLGKPTDEKNLEVIRRHQEMELYYQRCELELRHAKEDRIINNVTFFDLLTKSTRRALAVCVKNKNFRKILESCKYRKNYPTFAKRIQRRFDEAKNILNMTNDAAVILSAAMPCFDPGHVAIEHILSYLSYNDLKTLTK